MSLNLYNKWTVMIYLAVLSFSIHAQESIRLNQTGFYPNGPKFAVAVQTTSDVFHLTTPDLGDTVYTGSLGTAKIWSHSIESARLIDFSDFQESGTYTLVIENLGQSYPFVISENVHEPISIGSIKAFYFQRMSTSLHPLYAGLWNRPAGHPDTEVYVHASAASEARPENTIISAPKGWYDAGDYNKYIVNSGITTYTILAAYEHYPDYYQDLDTNIPESGNAIPDILDEVLWNLRWMLKMQDPADGGVYHKLSTANFSGVVMPHKATATRYVLQKSTPAALDFAAVMAQASRIYLDFEQELPGFADSCLAAALDAWNWAQENTNVPYDQSEVNDQYDPDITTGEYGGSIFEDEFQWASAELFITTKADSFLFMGSPLSGPFSIPWWKNVSTLGLYSLVHHRKDIGDVVDTTKAIESLINLANPLIDEVENSAYHVVMGLSDKDFIWGSNGVAGNQGMVLIQAYHVTKDKVYLDAAIQNLDYLLGRNGVGYSFVTGFGTKATRNPHHRQSEADGVSDPVPGLLAGGPNPDRQDGCSGYIGTGRATSYVDSWCSYASNEIAINWNAALVYLSGSIEAIYTADNASQVLVRSDNNNLPDQFGLNKNYPNPFNSSTNIVISLISRADARLAVYDISGKLIKTLHNGEISEGSWIVNWNGRSNEGLPVSSGIYIVRLEATQRDGMTLSDSLKMMMIR